MLRLLSFVFFVLFFSSTSVFAEDGEYSAAPKGASGKPFNPDTSVNFLGLGQSGSAISNDRTQTSHNGITLQEAEVQFTSDVDVYLRAVALFSVSQKANSTDYGIDPEEVYLETISLPNITVRAGKFKMALGKHNQLHTHAFPFIDAPLINQQLLGDEGLNESGVSADALVPLPWYSEITVQGMSLGNSSLYNSRSSGDWGGVAHLKNLWDLSEDLTMEFGLSGTAGNNQYGKSSSVLACDLTFKWRPSVGGKYRALIWSTEYLDGNRLGMVNATTNEAQQKLGGLATWLQYQFAQRWYAQARYEYVGLPRSPGISVESKESALLGFFPSEFSGIRVQYDLIQNQARPQTDHAISLQYNITIGAHPAHAY